VSSRGQRGPTVSDASIPAAQVDLRWYSSALAFFLAGVYLLVVFALVVTTVTGNPIPLVGWPVALVPAVVFVYSSIDAVKLHRTTDDAESKVLWRRSLLLAVMGAVLTAAVVVIINRIETS
jgi:4-hydroxybenzoate polyprenyltransferase